MKKLFTLLFLGIFFFSYAQKFQLIAPDGDPCTDGQIISATITEDDLNRDKEYIVNILVENKTDTELEMKSLRTNMVLCEGMEAYVCFYECQLPYIFDIDVTMWENSSEYYSLHLKPDACLCHFGQNQFKLEFWTEPGKTDLMTLLVNIDMQPLGVTEQNSEKMSLSAYPNPVAANSTLHVSYTLAEKHNAYNLVIRNILGAVVMSMPLNPYEKSTTVDIAPLVSGVYFYAIENKNQISISKKLIIK